MGVNSHPHTNPITNQGMKDECRLVAPFVAPTPDWCRQFLSSAGKIDGNRRVEGESRGLAKLRCNVYP